MRNIAHLHKNQETDIIVILNRRSIEKIEILRLHSEPVLVLDTENNGMEEVISGQSSIISWKIGGNGSPAFAEDDEIGAWDDEIEAQNDGTK